MGCTPSIAEEQIRPAQNMQTENDLLTSTVLNQFQFSPTSLEQLNCQLRKLMEFAFYCADAGDFQQLSISQTKHMHRIFQLLYQNPKLEQEKILFEAANFDSFDQITKFNLKLQLKRIYNVEIEDDGANLGYQEYLEFLRDNKIELIPQATYKVEFEEQKDKEAKAEEEINNEAPEPEKSKLQMQVITNATLETFAEEEVQENVVKSVKKAFQPQTKRKSALVNNLKFAEDAQETLEVSFDEVSIAKVQKQSRSTRTNTNTSNTNTQPGSNKPQIQEIKQMNRNQSERSVSIREEDISREQEIMSRMLEQKPITPIALQYPQMRSVCNSVLDRNESGNQLKGQDQKSLADQLRAGAQGFGQVAAQIMVEKPLKLRNQQSYQITKEVFNIRDLKNKSQVSKFDTSSYQASPHFKQLITNEKSENPKTVKEQDVAQELNVKQTQNTTSLVSVQSEQPQQKNSISQKDESMSLTDLDNREESMKGETALYIQQKELPPVEQSKLIISAADSAELKPQAVEPSPLGKSVAPTMQYLTQEERRFYAEYFNQFGEKKLEKDTFLKLINGLSLGLTTKQLSEIYETFELFDELDVVGFVWLVWVCKNVSLIRNPTIQEWMLSNGSAEEIIQVEMQGKEVNLTFDEFSKIMKLQEMEKKNMIDSK